MSKAFTKDDDGSSEPLVVAARAPLPADTPNYVTARGLALLRAELEQLEAERKELLSTDENDERRRALAVLAARAAELSARIGSAVLVGPPESPDEARFGAIVHTLAADESTRVYQIVGVDEADAKAGRVAFVSPLARALLGKRAGDVAVVRTPNGDEELEILRVEYEPE